MSLANRITQSVNKAFISLDDLAGDMTLRSQTSDPVYDEIAGSVTKTEKVFIVQGIFDKYETDRVDGTIIQKEDRLILVKPLDGLVPKISDTITGPDNIEYNIMDVNAITAYDIVFLWELQARK